MMFKQKSYLPLIANLIMDIIILKVKRKEEKFTQQKIYTFEYKRRFLGMFFYFLREPIFSSFTKPFVREVLSFLWIPTQLIEIGLNFLSYLTFFYFIV